jgi:hypothetical protein
MAIMLRKVAGDIQISGNRKYGFQVRLKGAMAIPKAVHNAKNSTKKTAEKKGKSLFAVIPR